MYRQSSISKASQREPHELQTVVPTVWESAVDSDTLLDYLFGVQQLHTGIYDYAEAVRSAGSLSSLERGVPVEWYKLTITESALTSADNLVTYGSGLVYGQGGTYGQIDSKRYAWAISSDIIEIGLVQDRVQAPTVIFDQSWAQVINGYLVFRQNPFDIMQPTQVGSDRQLTLWCRNVLLDKQLPYLRYGAVLGVAHTTDEAYVESLRRLWQVAVCGPSTDAVSRAVHAGLGIPYCEGDETVESIDNDGSYTVIATDKRVYRLHPSATVLVQVGDALTAGQALVDTLRIADLSSGTARNWSLLSDLPSIAVSPSAHNNGGQISFVNKDEAWVYYGANDVRCTLAGASADIAAFWANVKSRGLASTTLASHIGMTGPATSSAVNPMRFLLDIIGANTVIVRIRAEHVTSVSAGVFRRLPSLMPKHINYLFCMQAATTSDSMSLTTFTDTVLVTPAVAPLDTISTSGYDLSYTDYAPLVTAS
jgi:hypothetical protein